MKAVLFDLDGTLVNAGGAGRRALDRAVLALHGRRDVCSKFSLAGRTDLDNFRIACRKATGRAPSERETEEVRAEYLRRLPGAVRAAVRAGRYKLIPGIGALLAALSSRPGVLVGLGTGNVRPGADIKLGPSGLDRHFRFGGFGCDAYTRVSLLRTAVRRASRLAGSPIAPRDVYVVGDTDRDVKAGKAAGYRTGAVTCGFGDADEIRRAEPDLVAEDFRDLGLWLGWIAGSPSRSSAA